MKHDRRKLIRGLVFLTLPTLTVTIMVLILMNWPTVTQARITLTVSRGVFEVNGSDSKALLDSGGLEFITLAEFSRVEFTPKRLALNTNADSSADNVWKRLTFEPRVVLKGKDSFVTLQSLGRGGQILNISPILVKPTSRIILQIMGQTNLTLNLQISGQETLAHISPNGPFEIESTNSQITGINVPLRKDQTQILLAHLSDAEPFIQVDGRPDSFVLSVPLVTGRTMAFVPRGPIPVKMIDFTLENSDQGAPLSSLVSGTDLRISYPDYSGIGELVFRSPDVILLDRLEEFYIEEILLDNEKKGLTFRLRGFAGRIKVGMGAVSKSNGASFSRDCTVSSFEAIWQNKKLAIVFTIVVWLLVTLAGCYKFLKELKREN